VQPVQGFHVWSVQLILLFSIGYLFAAWGSLAEGIVPRTAQLANPKTRKSAPRKRKPRAKAAAKAKGKKQIRPAKAKAAAKAKGKKQTRPAKAGGHPVGHPRSEAPGPTLVKGTAALAQLLDVHQTTINRWVAKGMPVTGADTFDVAQVLAWRAAQDGKGDGQGGSADVELKQWRARHLQLKVLKDLKKLIPRGEAEAIWIQTIINVRTRMMALPDRVVLLVPARLRADLRVEVQHEVDRILGELQNGFLMPEIEGQVNAFIEALIPRDDDAHVAGAGA